MQLLEPRTRRWTRDEYYQMADLGWFQDQHVELIDGEIIEMSPQKNQHVVAIALVEEALRIAFGDNHWIRIRFPLHLESDSEPEPDVAVVPGKARDYQDHPTTALLVVEISDTTLSFDSKRKANLYAGAQIADYWIVNLVDGRLDVYRESIADQTAPFGHRYAAIKHLNRGESVAPLSCPDSKIAIADLLP